MGRQRRGRQSREARKGWESGENKGRRVGARRKSEHGWGRNEEEADNQGKVFVS